MSETKLDTLEAKASYGIGIQLGQQLANSNIDGLDVAAIAYGIETVLSGSVPAIEIDEINQALQALHQRTQAKNEEQAKVAAAASEAYLEQNAQRPEVAVTSSGLQYEILAAGDGEKPSGSQKVRVHYHGQLVDGTVFDSSVERGEPAEFPVNGVIQGWVEALQMMTVGSKWKLAIPHGLAYGEQGAGAAIPPYSALVFEVELLAIL
jgi:FKBP-type peptidyl-prolyl cis-trans isomerase FklB